MMSTLNSRLKCGYLGRFLTRGALSVIATLVIVAASSLAVTSGPASAATVPTVGVTFNAGTSTFTATVNGSASPGVPTGTGAWVLTSGSCTTVGSPVLAPVSATNNASATCTVASIGSGPFTAIATYSGDSNYTPGTPGLDNATSTSNSLAVAPSVSNSTTVGQTITFTLILTGSTPPPNAQPGLTPSGPMTWFITGPTGLIPCAATAGPTVQVQTNKSAYTCQVIPLTVGTYTVVAEFAGDSNYNGLVATTSLNVTIAQATPTVTVSSSLSTAALGQSVTFSATVTGPTGAPAPTGTITWTFSGAVTACSSQSLLVASTNYATETCTITPPAQGTYSATATYSGDLNYASRAGSSGSVTVTQATPTVAVAISPTAPTMGQTVTYSATVSAPTGGATPTGTMTWRLTGPYPTTPACGTASTGTGAANVTTYTCVVLAANAGTYNATAVYNGDANYKAVTASAASFAIATTAPTLSLTSSPVPPVPSQPLIFTVTVSGPVGASAPTGNVTWSVSGPASTNCQTAGPSSQLNVSTYSCTLTPAAIGTYSVTARYGGNASYVSATANASAIVVGATQGILSVTSLSGRVGTALALAAAGGSGLGAVTYQVARGTASSCTLSQGKLTAGSTGTCIVTATKAANGIYASASSAATTVSFVKSGLPARVTLTFGYASSALTVADKNKLTALARKLRSTSTVTIVGYSQNNATIASARANAAKRFLQTKVRATVVVRTVTATTLKTVIVTTTKV